MPGKSASPFLPWKSGSNRPQALYMEIPRSIRIPMNGNSIMPRLFPAKRISAAGLSYLPGRKQLSRST